MKLSPSSLSRVLGSVGGPSPLVSWDKPSGGGEEGPGTPAPLLTRLAQVSQDLSFDGRPCHPSAFTPPSFLCPQHMKWPSVSSLDSALETSPSSHSTADPSHLSPPAASPRPPRGHRRSASCGSPLSGGPEGASRGPGSGSGASGPGASDCRIIRVQMELGEDGSVYKSILVRSPGREVGKELSGG